MKNRLRSYLLASLLINLVYRVYSHGYDDLEPDFVDRIGNVTAIVGQEVELSCVVENLGSYRVAWIRVESQTILSIHTHVITRNYRISLRHKDLQYWNLHIINVQESDRGSYMCQINTVPMKKQLGYLEVVVPPQFVRSERTTEVLAHEGTNVTMTCFVKGYPTPKVTWHREDGKNFDAGLANPIIQQSTFEGERLLINKVSRLHMGTYVCTADNGVPPSVSRRTQLYVNFPPMLWIPNQLFVGKIGDNITLECLVEAFPKSLNYWTRHEDDQLVNSGNHFITTIQESTYKMHMRLTINKLRAEDFGKYTCLAKNSIGSTSGVIRINGTNISDSSSTTTTNLYPAEDTNSQLQDGILKSQRNAHNQSYSYPPASAQDTIFSDTVAVLPSFTVITIILYALSVV
ncbi:lachesin isoform X1 [Parasteatoda tepidariorum]|uniref:lachesin isoform X1 n=1 Tax=Parasteatoda tepidariorum TaxID=114398 RepID=UPI001C721980|nr:lachesin isoform X1 [Parasteatoda tepidariorum]